VLRKVNDAEDRKIGGILDRLRAQRERAGLTAATQPQSSKGAAERPPDGMPPWAVPGATRTPLDDIFGGEQPEPDLERVDA
jgi:hypothetical protein